MNTRFTFSLKWVIPLSLVFLILATSFVSLQQAKRQTTLLIEEEERSNIIILATRIQASLEYAGNRLDSSWVQEVISGLGSDRHMTQALLVNPQEQILASLRRAEQGVTLEKVYWKGGNETETIREMIRQTDQTGTYQVFMNELDAHLLVVAPIKLGSLQGLRELKSHHLVLHRDISQIQDKAIRTAEQGIYQIGMVMLILAGIFAFVLHILLSRRIERLVKSTEAIKNGEFERRINVGGPDELGLLAQSIEEMSQARQLAEIQRTEAHQRLLMLLDSIEAIVYIADAKSFELLYINNYTKRIFGDVVGLPCTSTIGFADDLHGPNSPCHLSCQECEDLNTCEENQKLDWESQAKNDGHWYHVRLRMIYWTDNKIVRLVVATDISAIKEVQQKLHQSENQLKHAIEATQESLWDRNLTTGEMYLSPRFEQMLGYEQGQITPQASSLKALIHPDDAGRRDDLWDLHAQGVLSHYEMEYRFRNSDRQWVWILDRGKIVERDASGTPVRAVGTFSDISARKKSEEDLRQSENLLKQAQTMVQMGSWTLCLTTHQLKWSEELFHLYGLEHENFNPDFDKLIELTLPQDREEFQRGIQEAIDNPERIVSFESRTLPPVGGVRLLRHQAQVDGTDSKHPLLIGISQDITQERKSKQRISLLAKVFEHATEAIIITDSKNRIIEVNKAFSEITGYEFTEVRGHDPKMLSSGRHTREFYHYMWTKIHEEGHWEGEIWDRRKGGDIYPKYLSISRFRDDLTKEVNYLGIFTDISKLKQSEEDLKKLAYYDSLTGLPNRIYGLEQLDTAIKLAKRHEESLAVLFLDLDHFKQVNDSLGHKAGDDLLCKAAEILKGSIRESDMVARLGGDEFLILLQGISGPQDCAQIGQSIINHISQPIQLEEGEVHINTSIGISIFPSDGTHSSDLIKKADTAMYHSKERGKGCYSFYTQEVEALAEQRLFLDQSMLKAIEQSEMHLVYQPQVELSSGRIVGVEALLRWQHPERGVIFPEEFIPLAEETGLMVSIGEMVLKQACEQGKRWQAQGIEGIDISVNLSSQQFHQESLAEKVLQILKESDFSANHLKVEITESMLMSEIQQAIDTLSRLKRAGIGTSIDDFGKGYSSLSYLQHFPVHDLKIDEAFIIDIIHDPRIATSVIHLAKGMGLRVIAEGVETLEQAQKLHELGCDLAQGYFFSEPMSTEETTELLQKSMILPEGFQGFS